jgi:hypothetical protein
MILCKWNEDWFICTGKNSSLGHYGLRSGAMMPHPATFSQYGSAWWYGIAKLTEHITFYPRISYKGCGGRPVMWKADTTEPILYCEIGTPPGWSRQQQEAKISELEAEGWKWDRRDGVGRGYVHVDDLEKVEGPPPEGAF